MTERRGTDPGERPTVDPAEQEQLAILAERLWAERAIPRAAFRSALRSRLTGQLSGTRARPRRVRALVAAYAGSGVCLLLIAAIGVAGAGPLAS